MNSIEMAIIIILGYLLAFLIGVWAGQCLIYERCEYKDEED